MTSVVVPAFDELKRRVSEIVSIYDEALALFRFVGEYQDLYRIYLSLPKSRPRRQAVDGAALELLAARCEGHQHTAEPFELSIEIVEAITGRLIHLYRDNINTYTPEQMASMHFDLVV